MTTTYHPLKFALTNGQKKKLQKAYASRTAVDLRIKPEQIGHGDTLLLTATQINRVKKAIKTKKGVDLKLSQTQIENTAQSGGNLFSAMLGLARLFFLNLFMHLRTTLLTELVKDARKPKI